MGCATSKLHDLPAVALCRQRCAFLDETIRHRYALSAAHLSYINSLQSLALSLQHLDFTSPPSPSLPPPSESGHNNDDGSGGNQLPPPFAYTDQSYPQAAAYMKHHAAPSQVYEQMPISPHAAHVGQYSSFPHTISNPSCYYGDQTFGGGSGGFYGSAPPYGPESSAVSSSSSQPPPRIYSPWGFDDSYYYSLHTTSQNLKEIREEEGIPDLEDDHYEYEVVEPVQGGPSADADGNGAGDHSKFTQDNQADLIEASLNQTVPISSMENDGVEVEHEVHVDDGLGDAFLVASEIEVQFRRASESGKEIACILEVGTLPYYRKRGAYQGKSSIYSF